MWRPHAGAATAPSTNGVASEVCIVRIRCSLGLAHALRNSRVVLESRAACSPATNEELAPAPLVVHAQSQFLRSWRFRQLVWSDDWLGQPPDFALDRRAVRNRSQGKRVGWLTRRGLLLASFFCFNFPAATSAFFAPSRFFSMIKKSSNICDALLGFPANCNAAS